MDVDEHIDLIDTLGDMLGQKDENKKDKFIDTMPTIIQMHLITEKDWAATTKKAKELEHIIRKCNPPAAALPTLAKDTAVPGLYSHIAHSNDKDEVEILQPFKGAHPKQPKPRGGGKGKQPQQKPKNPPPQTQDDQYNYEDTNNYYHNENYRGQSRGCRPYRGQNTGCSFGTVLMKINPTPHHQEESIPKVNIHTKMFLAMLTSNIMILIMVMHSLSQTNIQHFYNKNYKTLIGV